MRPVLKILAFALAVSILAGCPAKKQPAEPATPVNGRVLLAQVDVVTAQACPLCSRPVYACPVEPKAEETLGQALGAAFTEKRFEVIKGKIPAKNSEESPGITNWIELGKGLNAGYVAAAELYCWKEREGTALASQSPARVGFHLHVFDPATGKEIWGGNFYEQQQSLSENVLEFRKFARRRGKWITAEQLAAEGTIKLIDQLIEAQNKNASDSVH